MNKEKRKELKRNKEEILKIIDLIDTRLTIENIWSDEQDSYDNLPEGFQASERGEVMLENIDNLLDCLDKVGTATDYLLEVILLLNSLIDS